MKQRRKLMNLWIKQRDKSPDCIKNYSKRQLTTHSSSPDYVYNLNIPYFGHDSKRFLIKLKTLLNLNLK